MYDLFLSTWLQYIVIVLFSLFFVATFAGIIPASKKRTFSEESDALDIVFLGSCDRFASLASFITVSCIPGTPTCLPIKISTPGNPDNNELTGQYICNQVDRNKSYIRIVETYYATEIETGANNQAIIGFRSNRPWKALQASYYRRPSCTTATQVCLGSAQSAATSVVGSCTPSPVTTKNGWVLNSDEVYIVPNSFQTVLGTCYGSNAPTTCCSYINLSSGFTVATTIFYGICPNTPNNVLNTFPENEHHEQKHERPSQQRPSQQKPSQNQDDFDKRSN